MNLVVELKEVGFEKEVLLSENLCLVEFGAVWCGPCKKQLPILEKLAEKYQDKLKVYKVDVDDAPGAVAKLHVKSVPTMFLFKNGEVVETKHGLCNLSTLEKLFERYLS